MIELTELKEAINRLGEAAKGLENGTATLTIQITDGRIERVTTKRESECVQRGQGDEER